MASILLAALLLQEEGIDLKLKFKSGDREQLMIDLKESGESTITAGREKVTTKRSGTSSIVLSIQCVKATEGAYEMKASYGEFAMTRLFENGSEKRTVTIKNDEVRLESQGRVIVDTEKGLQGEKGRKLLADVRPESKTGALSMDTRGVLTAEMTELGGPFRGAGLYAFVLPEKAVKPGETWSRKVKFTHLGEMKLPKPADVVQTCKLERFEGEGERREAVITMSVEKTFEAFEYEAEMSNGKTATFSFKTLKISGSSWNRLLVEPGRVHSCAMDVTVTATGSVTPEGMEEGVPISMKATISGTIIPRK